ncbi:MAG: diguanylate cyclase [Planctomycetales bacterium]|nr:diguanylate cyclase [Planctomycetales bacterium]
MRLAEDQLAFNRLGIAGGLFASLRAKHSPTASHCLRVALGLSSWARAIGLEDPHLQTLETAALMHDIGKIGVPDSILTKPGKLDADEISVLDRYRLHGLDILSSCCLSDEIIDMVRFAGTWYDGSRGDSERQRDQLPIGSRMLSIVDAYDSMTTDHVYRRAMTPERAVAELTSYSGTQFDPKLVENYRRLLEADQIRMDGSRSERWLTRMDASQARTFWGLGRMTKTTGGTGVDQLFQQKLVNSMVDGVVFVDSQCNILLWNRAFERITGIASGSVFQKQWLPSMLDMREPDGSRITDQGCPIAETIRSRSPFSGRFSFQGRSGNRTLVEAHVHPVTNIESVVFGAVIIARDVSSEATLEAAIENLHTKATQDPLTKVSNRAEFDRVHELFVKEHLAKSTPCSLIICDLDFFKRVNDDFGHQAGDDALMIFASILKRFRRQGDLVARYGGEEFVILCASCDGQGAVDIAEEIRQTLERTPQPLLKGKCCTSSFGVTEIQDGDTAETMLRRADRALMQAKEAGRNRVLQLGNGLTPGAKPAKSETKKGLLNWFRSSDQTETHDRELLTTVPLEIAVEKLRGFISDQHGQITKVDGDTVVVKVDAKSSNVPKRGERSVPMTVEMTLTEVDAGSGLLPDGVIFGTLIKASIEPIRTRDRRRTDLDLFITQLVSSMKSYFMAFEPKKETSPALERAVTRPGEGR